MTDQNAPQTPTEDAQTPQADPISPVTDPAQTQQAGNQVGPNVTSTNPEAPTTEPEAEVDLYGDPFNDPKPKPGTVFYCPACGKRVGYRQQCTGTPEQPHQPQEVVDATELWDSVGYEDSRGKVHDDQHDPDKLTAAAPSPGDGGTVA